jgi:hypothetical protein
MQSKSPSRPVLPIARYKTVIEIPASCINRARCIMPSAEELLDASNPARAGLIRHGGVGKPDNRVPQSYKHPYGVHVQHYLRTFGEADQDIRRTILMLGSRNSFQNLLLPIWLNGQLVCRFDEPWQTAIYTALCCKASGGLAIQKVRFRELNGQTTITGEDFELVGWAVTGQPVLYHGEIPPISLLTAMTYDLRHVFHLLWENWQTERFPEYRWHKDAHDELMDAFMQNLSLDVKTRGAALSEIAARRALQVEEGYLHSSLGLRCDGTLISLMMTGSLHDHGRVQRELGAESAVLLDNGGSVSAAYWSAKDWDANAFRGQTTPQPVFFGGGSYFRNVALTTLLFELNGDILEEPFCPRPQGDQPWTPW